MNSINIAAVYDPPHPGKRFKEKRMPKIRKQLNPALRSVKPEIAAKRAKLNSL